MILNVKTCDYHSWNTVSVIGDILHKLKSRCPRASYSLIFLSELSYCLWEGIGYVILNPSWGFLYKKKSLYRLHHAIYCLINIWSQLRIVYIWFKLSQTSLTDQTRSLDHANQMSHPSFVTSQTYIFTLDILCQPVIRFFWHSANLSTQWTVKKIMQESLYMVTKYICEK